MEAKLLKKTKKKKKPRRGEGRTLLKLKINLCQGIGVISHFEKNQSFKANILGDIYVIWVEIMAHIIPINTSAVLSVI